MDSHEEATRQPTGLAPGPGTPPSPPASPAPLSSASSASELPDVQPVAAIAAPKFCRRCGIAWDANWESCPQCARAGADVAQRPAALLGYERDRRVILSAVWLYFALLSVSAVTILVALARDDKHEPLGVTAEFVISGAMTAITLAWCVGSRAQVVPFLGRRVAPGWFAVAAGCAIPTFLIAHATVTALVRTFGLEDIAYLDSFQREGYGLSWGVLLICVQPGVFEELAFRGVILSSLQLAIGNKEALLVSAMMFAILHLSLPSMPHLFVIGLVLGWLRLRTGSLLPGMLMHFTHNLLVVVAEHRGGTFVW